jgi:hypothetical protein
LLDGAVGAAILRNSGPRSRSAAEVAIPRNLFAESFGSSRNCGRRRSRQQRNEFDLSRFATKTAGDVRLDDRNFGIPRRATASRPAPKRI